MKECIKKVFGWLRLRKENFKILPLKIKFLIVIVPLFLLSLILFLSLSVFLNKDNSRLVQRNNVPAVIPTTNPIPTYFHTETETGNDEAAGWSIIKNTPDGIKIIKNLKLPDLWGNQIIQWGDWIFYGSGDYVSNVQVFGFNLKTEEEKIIYDQEKEGYLSAEGNRRYVGEMQIINNGLFFSIGGYLASGAIYWINLPPQGTAKRLVGQANGRIEYMNNQYWVIGGEGDACGGGQTYSLLDINTKKVTHIADSLLGCVDGEEYIGIDIRNRMILSYHTGENSDNIDYAYKYVTAIPLLNPSVKEGIIAKQNMPAGISSVYYSEKDDQLWLSGKENYIFDFKTKEIVKVDTKFVIPTPTPEVQEKSFRDKIKDIRLPEGYEFMF